MSARPATPLQQARDLLGVKAGAAPGDLRRAYRVAAKAAHPDRPGGSVERFQAVAEAYRLLLPAQRPAPPRIEPPPAEPAYDLLLTASPAVAVAGGTVVHRLSPARALRLHLPPGLRDGDRVRAGGVELVVAISRDGAMLVRGDDLWITVDVEPRLLSRGGRIAVETPIGRRIVWVDRKAGARGLVRVVGQGLPARGSRRQGDLFLRLSPQAGRVDSAARALLRRFAAAWAA